MLKIIVFMTTLMAFSATAHATDTTSNVCEQVFQQTSAEILGAENIGALIQAWKKKVAESSRHYRRIASECLRGNAIGYFATAKTADQTNLGKTFLLKSEIFSKGLE